jgi:nucleoside-diphosphate-sugar epimerase
MKMNVLVTGATGLLGNNVLRQLLDAGHHAQILVRPTSDLRAIDGLCSRDGTPIGIHQGDVTDKISIRKAASKATHIGKAWIGNGMSMFPVREMSERLRRNSESQWYMSLP